MSSSTPQKPGQWEPMGATNMDLIDQDARGGLQSQTDRMFRLIHEPVESSDSSLEFVPLYASQMDDAPPVEAGKDSTEGKDEKTDSTNTEEILRHAHEEGLSAGKQEARAIVERMQHLLEQMEGLWQHLVQLYEPQILGLICRVAEKVVSGQVNLDHDLIRRAILDAIHMIPEPVEVTVEINPEDADHIEAVKEDFFSCVKTLKHMSIIPDPSVSRGGCRLKTHLGEVDASLESRLDAIQQTIMDVCGKKPNRDADGT